MKKLILLFAMALVMQSCIVIKMPSFGELYVMELTPEEKTMYIGHLTPHL